MLYSYSDYQNAVVKVLDKIEKSKYSDRDFREIMYIELSYHCREVIETMEFYSDSYSVEEFINKFSRMRESRYYGNKYSISCDKHFLLNILKRMSKLFSSFGWAYTFGGETFDLYSGCYSLKGCWLSCLCLADVLGQEKGWKGFQVCRYDGYLSRDSETFRRALRSLRDNNNLRYLSTHDLDCVEIGEDEDRTPDQVEEEMMDGWDEKKKVRARKLIAEIRSLSEFKAEKYYWY